MEGLGLSGLGLNFRGDSDAGGRSEVGCRERGLEDASELGLPQKGSPLVSKASDFYISAPLPEPRVCV